MPSRLNALASVPPPRQYGTTTAAGSSSRTASAIDANHSVSTGASTGGWCSRNSRVTPSDSNESMVASSSSTVPGRVRTSSWAAAVPGMTFTLYPACSIVGVVEHRTVFSTSFAAGPRRAIVPSTSSRSTSTPSALPAPTRNASTVGVSRTGCWCAAMRANEVTSAVTAFWSFLRDPWPARPTAVSFMCEVPRSAVPIGYSRVPFTSKENPPDSLIAASTPAKWAAWCSTSQCAPYTPWSSSSATNASTTSRRGRRPSTCQRLTTASVIAAMSFMSTAPRPCTNPSRISPANGSKLHSDASAGTTSRCDWTSTAGSAGSVPGMRARTLVRRGAGSSSVGGTPLSRRIVATCSAASRSPAESPPPRLVVSKRMSRAHVCATSSVMPPPYVQP